MAHEWERGEHRRAVRAMTEWDRAVVTGEIRRSVGIVGDADDDANHCGTEGGDE